ncbi:MAG: hypothetical protein RML14_06865 [Meiothermus sp.]|uniref:hypothetical protein n=1 Tax=Meiothermus sp. TaxID=1955249 RepID=UPI00298EDEE6|nr:hypothetical protein [Meiothermus sp.]MDW8481588.1 hypothetical protein [Meiothermus sp.]
MSAQDFPRLLAQARVVGVLRAPAASRHEAARAAARGGSRALELTFTTPGVLEALRELRKRLPEGVLLGTGTVMSVQQGRSALEAGAQFLVSPHLSEELLESGARSRHTLCAWGALTYRDRAGQDPGGRGD